MSCYGCACDHCLYNAELEAWYMTPGEVQNAEDICFCCDECKHYDGDFSKRSQWRPDCPRHKFPEKYLEMQRIAEQRRARAAETRRRNFQIIKGGKPEQIKKPPPPEGRQPVTMLFYHMGGDKINGQITGEHQGHHHAGR